jgi:predicted HicB family RNase H-like nuclease
MTLQGLEQAFSSLYTRNVVGVPSLAEDVAPSYRISLQRSGEGPSSTWLAEVEELPNCSGRGATPEEAVRLAWAAVDGRLGQESERAEGAETKAEPRHSGKLLVRMPATLHDELARAAESEGVSLNQLITGVLAGAVEWRAGDTAVQGSAPAAGAGSSPRLARIALAANVVAVVLAGIVAIALLVLGWQNGW